MERDVLRAGGPSSPLLESVWRIMRELGVGEELWLAVTNIALLALSAVLPILLVAYVRHSLTVKRIRPKFSLRKSEATELNRAKLLYATVRRHLKISTMKTRALSAGVRFWPIVPIIIPRMCKNWRIWKPMSSTCERRSVG